MLPNDEKFRFESIVRGDQKVVLLKGDIDEDAVFDGIKALADNLVLNFKEVKSINSCGVRSWVNFMKDMARFKIKYEECPPAIVRQMNMIPSFLGHAEILSVFVPYVNDDTGTEKLVLYPASKFKSVPSVIHTEEGEMELDAHPAQYFAFAK